MSLLIKLIPIVFVLFTLNGCQEEVPKKEMVRSVRAMQVTDASEFAKRWFPGQAKATQEHDLLMWATPLVRARCSQGLIQGISRSSFEM
jgi:hypothetical protein